MHFMGYTVSPYGTNQLKRNKSCFRGPLIFDRLTLHIEAGERIALLGAMAQ